MKLAQQITSYYADHPAPDMYAVYDIIYQAFAAVESPAKIALGYATEITTYIGIYDCCQPLRMNTAWCECGKQNVRNYTCNADTPHQYISWFTDRVKYSEVLAPEHRPHC